MLLPEQRVYPAEGQDMTDTAIRTTGLRDLYLALGDDRGNGRLDLARLCLAAGAVHLAGRAGDGAGRDAEPVGPLARASAGEPSRRRAQPAE